MAFDNLCKYLAETFPNDFAKWLLGETLPEVEVLKTELGSEPIRADSVTLLRGTNRILHLEFQVEPGSVPALPLRMLDYWVRIYRRYELPVSQILLILRETNIKIPDTFQVEETRHRFRVVKMWEENPSPLLENENLLPFAVLAKANKKAKLLEEVAQKAKSITEVEKQREILTQTDVLAGLRFPKNLIKRLLKEDIMKESVTYQEIVEEGIEIGRQRAFQEAKKREAGLILRQLKHRFGRIDAKSKAKIEQFSFAELENLGEALLDFISKEDLKVWLEKQK